MKGGSTFHDTNITELGLFNEFHYLTGISYLYKYKYIYLDLLSKPKVWRTYGWTTLECKKASPFKTKAIDIETNKKRLKNKHPILSNITF